MFQQLLDWPFRNSTSDANCGVAPVLASSSIRYTLSRCAPEASGTSSPAASLERSLLLKIVLLFSFLLAMPLALAVERQGKESLIPDLLLVDDPGNVPDSSGYGAVSESFFLSKYPITVDQWAFFMNSVHVDPEDKNDFRELYHSEMRDDQNLSSSLQVGFMEEGKDSFDLQKSVYSARHLVSSFFPATIKSHGSFPITNMTPDDAKRYCNWCEHGFPQTITLEEALTVTENGAYDFTHGKKGDAVVGAIYSLPTADLLYKAMYYKGGKSNAGYWCYPMQSDSLPTDSFFSFCEQKREGANSALIKYNWLWKPYTVYYTGEAPYLTPVGFFDGSPGPYGHYDLGGNVRVWTSSSMATKEGIAFLALGGSWEETGDVLKKTMACKELFLPGCYTTIGMRIAALSDQRKAAPLANLGLQEPTTLPTSKPTNKNCSNLFWESLEDMACAQITAYMLEAALNAFFLVDPPAFLAMEAGESLLPWLWKYFSKSCEPFTMPRNLVNAVLTLFNAASMSTETAVSMQDDSWGTIALLTGESILTMVCVEGSGALVEKPVEWLLDLLKINKGANKAEAGWTLVRAFLNIYYIGAGTYWNVQSDIQNYQKQHPPS